MADKKWIQSIGMKKGALHKDLGVPQGKPIPLAKLRKAAVGNGKTAQRARLAETLKGFKHGS